MSDRSTLARQPGTLSGRIQPTGWSAPDGSWVMCLGSDVPGYTGRFKHAADIVVAEVNGSTDADTVATFRARLRSQLAPLPGNWVWRFSVYGEHASGSVGFDIDLEPGRTLDMPDLALPLALSDGIFNIFLFLRPWNLDMVLNSIEELEIPAIYFDTFLVDTIPDGLGVFNRLPPADNVGAALATPVSFHLISTTGTAPDMAATTVYIGGVAVFTNGVDEPGYVSTVTAHGAAAWVVSIQPDVPFESEELVDVRVVSTLGATTIVQDWSFEIIDETPPRLHSANSPSHDRVRVRFDEAVRMIDAASSDDALNPANWEIVPTMAPAVTVEVVSVELVSDVEVDLIFDIPITRGAVYEVTASNVEDLIGNTIESPNDTVSFVGYECPVPATRRFDLWRLVADMDRRRDETRDLYKFLAMLQEPTDLLLCDVDRWVEILDVDIAEERYVDHMLIQLGNPFDFDLELIDKRRLVRSLIRVYQQKGTGVGIINVIRFFMGLEVTITRYNEDGWLLGVHEIGVDTILAPSSSYARYSFDVESPTELTDAQRAQLRELVVYMKPAHTHFIRLNEPEALEEGTEYWLLGVSLLGADAILYASAAPYYLAVDGGEVVAVDGGEIVEVEA